MYGLRELEKSDMPKINRWRNDRELINYLGAPFRYINIDVDYKWYDNYLQNRQGNIRCAIIETDNKDDILGLVSLTNINFINQSGEFHIMIGSSENRGKGIGYLATLEILDHAFNNMNLNRIELSVLEDNQPAISLYEKIGFKCEGIKRKSTYKDGRFFNMLIMSILKDEFNKLHRLNTGGGYNPLLSHYCISKLETFDEIQETLIYMSDSYAKPNKERKLKLNEYANKLYTNANFFIAYNNDLLGFIAFYANDKETNISYITQIVVKKEFQNKSIGKKLLNLSIEISRELGMKYIKLEVARDNYKAIKFYEKNGFKSSSEISEKSIYMIKKTI